MIISPQNNTITASVTLPDTALNRQLVSHGLNMLISGFAKRCANDDAIAAEVMDNFPECGMTVRCMGWHYMDQDGNDIPNDEKWLWFAPDEEGLEASDYVVDAQEVNTNIGKATVYVVTHQMIKQALPILRLKMDDGWFRDYAEADKCDTWDGCVYDAIIQLCLFGDIIMS